MGNCLAFNEFAVRVETFQRAAIKMILKSLHGSRLAYFNLYFETGLNWALIWLLLSAGYTGISIKICIYITDMHIYIVYIFVFA